MESLISALEAPQFRFIYAMMAAWSLASAMLLFDTKPGVRIHRVFFGKKRELVTNNSGSGSEASREQTVFSARKIAASLGTLLLVSIAVWLLTDFRYGEMILGLSWGFILASLNAIVCAWAGDNLEDKGIPEEFAPNRLSGDRRRPG